MKLTQLFTSARKWCKLKLAMDAHKEGVGPLEPSAVRWCLLGGIRRCDGGWTVEGEAKVCKVASVIAELYPEFDGGPTNETGTIVDFNNAPKTNFRKLLRVIRKANV